MTVITLGLWWALFAWDARSHSFVLDGLYRTPAECSAAMVKRTEEDVRCVPTTPKHAD